MIRRRASERNLLLVLSLAVGVFSGLAAVLLTRAIGLLQRGFAPLLQAYSPWHSLWFFLLPGAGMLIALLMVRYVIRDDIGHGVTRVLHSVSRNESRIKAHNMWSSMATSAVTIGFGGSVGAEAPIVYTGAAIGSNLARWFGLSYRNVTILLGCGAAGAIAGIFKAPLAGVLFTLEILLFNISMSSMVPLLISTMSASVVAYLLQGTEPAFACTLDPFSMRNIPFYVVLGVAGGFCSLYFTRTTLWLEDRFARMKQPYVKWALCAAGAGLLIFLMPPLFGEGYGAVRSLLAGEDAALMAASPISGLMASDWGIPLMFALIFLLKIIAMTLTNAGGGVGGTFGPTLVAGAIAGFVVSRALNLAMAGSGFSLPEANFVLVGMAALMAGVMQAPMTAIFLIAEITGGYDLFLPLIVASTVSYGVTRIWERYSIYTKRLAQSGELLTHDSDQAALALMNTAGLIRDKYPRVKIDDSLGSVMRTIADSTTQVLAVVDDKDIFQGLIDVNTLRPYMFRTEEYETLRVRNFLEQPPEFIWEDDHPGEVMAKFDRTAAWRLPVLSKDGRYLGFISNSRLLMAYREELKQISGD